MILSVEKSQLTGEVRIPASKSHTIRAVAIASLASGESVLSNPLAAADPIAATEVYRGLGASITVDDAWIIEGTGGALKVPDNVLDVRNSGATLYTSMVSASLVNGYSVFTGDEQIRKRPAKPLIDALNDLGAQAFSTRGNGSAPLVIKGPLKGGYTILDGSKTSQYLTGLLINTPLASEDTEIEVRNAIEKPFIEMTLAWLNEQEIKYEREGFKRFLVSGRQSYKAFKKSIPGDFSSAAFFLCAAAITGSELTLLGLDMNDTQGDKAVVDMLRAMGAKVDVVPGGIRIMGGDLKAAEFDLSGTPDALPAMAVTACFAEGTTRLVNVPQARLKETDRICVMRRELAEMGAEIEELVDGLVIQGKPLHAAKVHGHGDHRVVMALAVAGLACKGITEIDTAESMNITFPNFVDLMQNAGAKMKLIQQ